VFHDYYQLLRPRIVAMVLLTMAVAALVVGSEFPEWPKLAHALFGTGLVIVGAIVLNQRLERLTDARMARTAPRPLPSGRLSAGRVTWLGLAATLAGLAYLGWQCTPTLVALSAASWGVYVLVYTPLKPWSIWQTPIGAIAGAMPALLGAAAADGLWTGRAAALFGVVYLWQLPHAMAIAWIYRHEFAAARLRLPTVADPSGRMAGLLAVAGAAILLPVSLTAAIADPSAYVYRIVALMLGAGYLAAAAAFSAWPSDLAARRLLRTSLVYLVLLLAALLWERF
jgi:protoheme IX farnesyltransferase